ncbi:MULTISPECIES: hypothetical protein [unclassified Legionella]|uniref:hypothetical protein n=1 Tax=unclassified Legionella TaxID=2622702 RepID=UPI0010561B05|nr:MULTISPECIES: hypothetical protein [unclassified Legionella]MDI9818482.1 hypothetical protein [Legionella sp. PL877]
MKCYALAARFGEHPFQWVTTDNLLPTHNFFARQAINSYKQEIISFCEKLIPGEIQGTKKNGYFFYAARLGSDYCIAVLDTQLTETQMNFLSYYLLRLKLDLQTVANDLEKYTKDNKLEEINLQLAETRELMLENLEQILKRGESIERLLERSEELKNSSLSFKHESRKLTTCWPCNLI